jgi:hypothetical protein
MTELLEVYQEPIPHDLVLILEETRKSHIFGTSEKRGILKYYFLDGVEQGYSLMYSDNVNTKTKGRKWCPSILTQYKVLRQRNGGFEKALEKAYADDDEGV